MIKEEFIKISISYRNISHYEKLGYVSEINKNITIDPIHLPSGSHVRITAICKICKAEISIIYYKYIQNVKRHGFYGCKKCSRQKAALTSIKKYGVDNYSKTEEFKKRVEKTNLEKYGHKTNLMNKEFILKIRSILKEKYGSEDFFKINRHGKKTNKYFKLIKGIDNLKSEIILSESLYSLEFLKNNFHKYRNECRRITNTNIKSILLDWDGLDYYDNENIFDNFSLYKDDPNYPTIDHKISIYVGFCNKKSPSEIGDSSNLCITKRTHNSRKRILSEEVFKKIFFGV